MFSQRTRFLIVLGLMVSFLLGMAGFHLYVRTTGQKVVLETRPVDPRSLFRGDYVILRYEINDVPCEKVSRTVEGSTVYVSLEKRGGVWTATSLNRTYPEDLPEVGTVIQGQLSDAAAEECRVEYPSIQSYYVPEGEGKQIERERGDGLRVEVSLSREGFPVINRLIFTE